MRKDSTFSISSQQSQWLGKDAGVMKGESGDSSIGHSQHPLLTEHLLWARNCIKIMTDNKIEAQVTWSAQAMVQSDKFNFSFFCL